PEVVKMFAVGGYSQLGSGPNMAMLFVTLRPWDERTNQESSVAALVERLRAPFAAIGSARVMPFQPPAIRGVGTVGGFQFVVEDRSGTRSLEEMSEVVDNLVARGNQDPELRGVFSSFTASTPM